MRRFACLATQVPAIPVDLFRIAVGVLSLVWFAGNLSDAPDTLLSTAIIDHDLLARVFWFTRWGLFQPGTPDAVLLAAQAAGVVFSITLILGARPRLSAVLLYLLAVSTYRWRFLVMYVEDAFIHFLLLWTILLPIGKTFTLRGWLRHGSRSWSIWREACVPGFVVRALIGSVGLFYLASGLRKWTSPYWRSGFALFATLKLPVSRNPEFWSVEHQSWLQLMTWATLVLEPLMPVMFVLRRGHPLKGLLFLAALGLHVGIILTIRVPLANFGCLAVLLLVFRDEIVGANALPRVGTRLGWRERVAMVLLFTIGCAMLRGVPYIGEVHKPAYLALWLGGLAIEYRLFDWIDDANVAAEYELFERPVAGPPRRVPNERLFPPGNRSMLLQAYLHNLVWMPVPAGERAAIKDSIFAGFARRYVRRWGLDGSMMVMVSRQRCTPDNMELLRGHPSLLFEFKVANGQVELLRTDPSVRTATNRPALSVRRSWPGR
ncbi:MAG: hypothetical protein KDB53_00945 [Planctomycetes bacterium]|nr:hypothetical protein [Planctomycetota bacterium]